VNEPALPDLSGLSREELALLSLDTRTSSAEPVPAETLAARRALYRLDVEEPRTAARLSSVEFAMREAVAPPSPWEGTPVPWPEPEDRSTATLSPQGGVEYIEDFLKPGRIVLVAAEEGSGKSYAITGELGIRVAVAGGAFAGTWAVLANAVVLVLSEMHADDDFQREETILASLEKSRADLAGRYYRLPLYTAANGEPALRVAEWRKYIVEWSRGRDVRLLIVDTATGAADVDPWGREIQAVYRDLRAMLADYPELAIILGSGGQLDLDSARRPE
jgi:hypothetical protein